MSFANSESDIALYACRQCPAKCCRFPWLILTTQEEVARYQSTPWIQEYLARLGKQFKPDAQDNYSMPSHAFPDGGQGCVFLDTDNRCLIHLREGHQAIPLTCQIYPFSFVKNSDGSKTRYHLSHFCQSILHRYGEPLASMLPQRWETARASGSGLLSQQPTLTLALRHTLTEPAYHALLDALQNIVTRTEAPVQQALYAGRKFLDACIASFDQQPCTPETIQALAQSFPLAQELEASLAGIPRHSLAGRVIMGIHMLNYSDLKPLENGKKHTVMDNLRQLLPAIMEKGRFELWGIPPLAVDRQRARQVRVPIQSPGAQTLLRDYYRHLFDSGILATAASRDILEQYFLLASTYSLILRLARCFAGAHGRTQATLEDIREGLGYADITASSTRGLPESPLLKMRQSLLQSLSLMPGTFTKVLCCED